MAKTVNALKARQNFGELLNEVFYGKEIITIERAGKAMAVIAPVDEYSQWQEERNRLESALQEAKKQLETTLSTLSTLLETASSKKG